MPFEHQLTPYETSLLETSSASKKAVGFDGLYSLPDDQRILLEAEGIGGRALLMRVIQHLQLDHTAARALYFGLLNTPGAQSVHEVETFFQDVQRLR